jgi:hypothetical protein
VLPVKVEAQKARHLRCLALGCLISSERTLEAIEPTFGMAFHILGLD